MDTPTVAFTKPSLPSYICDPPASICTRGADYLTRMGCFSLPPPRLRNELMASYLGFMHPKLPLFDLPRFCTSMHRYDGSSQLSLLIFQAIMFAGAAFVDMSYLQSAGYSSRAEARKELYQRTRLLYDYRYESDVVTVLHALLIVTHSAAHVGMDLPTQRAPTPAQVPPPPGPGPPGAVYVPFASQPDEPSSDTQSTLSGMTREGEMEMGFGTVALNPVQYVAPGGAFPGQCILHLNTH
ncbi:hypothetical protein ASPVEDRAFT_41456 [Aspergillus versicolor CBS 583.65]|uniref:Xylanolytic transcriptional activator regulatory domain-containing protein n=1 Tax=Aspergillus versicolor CBS 583.65 TaxID=1036611 RepID=A0A1L9PKD2_ASPVE|nr:uncharacterized protein ASPVEDRAFT_41456 [Aspergillus versicolor CBS 583.65]OJJ01896.1 hypothetical protein ASPVEDRAFT_41456 [Aspergillus versicolor CBS 583.65]